MKGKVVSVYGSTVIVAVSHPYRHPLYKKTVNRVRKHAAHYTGTGIHIGDMVEIKETRPISKRKHFNVVI